MDPGTLVALDAIIQLIVLLITRLDPPEPTEAEKADSTKRLGESVDRLKQLIDDKFGDPE